MRRIITFNISVISARLKMTGRNNRILFRAPLGTVVDLWQWTRVKHNLHELHDSRGRHLAELPCAHTAKFFLQNLTMSIRHMLPLANAKVVFRSRWYADWRHIAPVYIEVIWELPQTLRAAGTRATRIVSHCACGTVDRAAAYMQ
jgi:hypothetical protein